MSSKILEENNESNENIETIDGGDHIINIIKKDEGLTVLIQGTGYGVTMLTIPFTKPPQ